MISNGLREEFFEHYGLSILRPITRRIAVTVRLPVARIAPTNKICTLVHVDWWKIGRNGRNNAIIGSARISICGLSWWFGHSLFYLYCIAYLKSSSGRIQKYPSYLCSLSSQAKARVSASFLLDLLPCFWAKSAGFYFLDLSYPQIWGVVATESFVRGLKLVDNDRCFRLSPVLKPISMRLILFFAIALDLAESRIPLGKTISFGKFYRYIWGF